MINGTILSIDPGSANGAVAILKDQKLIEIVKLDTKKASELRTVFEHMQRRHLNRWHPEGFCRIVIEDVGTSRPGNSAKAAYSFAVHRGQLEMLSAFLFNDKVSWVRPQVWSSAMWRHFSLTPILNKPEKKAKTAELVNGLYPDRKKIPLYAADAVMLAYLASIRMI